MPRFDYNTYAQRGAETRIAELQAELADIFSLFPDLRRTGSNPARRGRPAKGQAALGALTNAVFAAVDTAFKRRRTRTPMTAAQRKAVGLRMKKHWADRKRKTAKAKTGAEEVRHTATDWRRFCATLIAAPRLRPASTRDPFASSARSSGLLNRKPASFEKRSSERNFCRRGREPLSRCNVVAPQVISPPSPARFHSALRATTGSTRVARRTGRYDATPEMTASTSATMTKVQGSKREISNSIPADTASATAQRAGRLINRAP